MMQVHNGTTNNVGWLRVKIKYIIKVGYMVDCILVVVRGYMIEMGHEETFVSFV